jgi:hypothetical protein
LRQHRLPQDAKQFAPIERPLAHHRKVGRFI